MIIKNTQKKIVGQLRSSQRSSPGEFTTCSAQPANGKTNAISTQYERIISCHKHWATCECKQTRLRSSVMRCDLLSDHGHGYPSVDQWLKGSKTGLPINPLSLECSLDCLVDIFLWISVMFRILWSCLRGCMIWVYGPRTGRTFGPTYRTLPAYSIGLIIVHLGVRVVWCPAHRPFSDTRECSMVSWYELLLN
jgi:hypothetical protein